MSQTQKYTSKTRLFAKAYNLSPFAKTVKQKIVFYHLPKCGGTSTHHALKNAYGIKENLYGKNLLKLDHFASKTAAELQGKDMIAFREQLLLYMLSKRHAKFVSGHFAFSKLADEYYGKDWEYITILRDPVKRWFSHFYFNHTIKSGDKNWPAEKINKALRDFLKNDPDRAFGMGLNYTAMLNGVSTEELVKSKADFTTYVDGAIDTLKLFSLVGITENLLPFQAQFKKHFGVSLKVKRLNVNKKKPLAYQEIISPELYSKIEQLCANDMEIYTFAKSLNDNI